MFRSSPWRLRIFRVLPLVLGGGSMTGKKTYEPDPKPLPKPKKGKK